MKNVLELITLTPQIFTAYISPSVEHYEDFDTPPEEMIINWIKDTNGKDITEAVQCNYNAYKTLVKNKMIEKNGKITFIADTCFRNVRFAEYKKLEG